MKTITRRSRIDVKIAYERLWLVRILSIVLVEVLAVVEVVVLTEGRTAKAALVIINY